MGAGPIPSRPLLCRRCHRSGAASFPEGLRDPPGGASAGLGRPPLSPEGSPRRAPVKTPSASGITPRTREAPRPRLRPTPGGGCRMAVPPLPCGVGALCPCSEVLRPERLSSACAGARMLRSRRGSALLSPPLLPVALGEAGEVAASGQPRPFAVLRRQNLALLGSVLGLLLLAALLLAVCVYRPLRRR